MIIKNNRIAVLILLVFGAVAGFSIVFLQPVSPSAQNLGLTIKFEEGSGVRLRDGKFVSSSGADLSEVNDFISRQHLIASKVFSQPEEPLEAEFQVFHQQDPTVKDLNLFFILKKRNSLDPKEATFIVHTLQSYPVVESAYINSPGFLPMPQ